MAKMAPANMYRVGDYVYFEANSGCPYQIRRIEELNKTTTGNVEAKVMCFFRRRDISVALLAAFNRCSRSAVTEENASEATGKTEAPAEPPPPADETPFMPGQENLNSEEKHLLTHRELFLSRQIEVLPATHIRGKCSVALLNEVETPDDYLKREDAFFYSLIYDPDLRTLVADKGEIRIGEDYQAVIPECIGQAACEAENTRTDVLMFDSTRCVSETLLDQYLVIARAVGTFARALDMNTLVKIPSLHMCAASAVRDVTTQQAMNMLHQADYDIGKAVLAFVPMPNRETTNSSNDKSASGQAGGPLMARDQLEEWSAAEANLFEEALEKYGKDFNDIRSDFLPWKGLRNIVEYYYMYKTTDRYVQQKRAKAAEAESRLKQVYIPTYTKPNPNIISSNPAAPALCCESCKTNASDQWYAWGPVSLQMRLCKDCWSYWKRYGGLKMPHKYENYDRTTGSMTSEQAPGGVQNASKLNGRSGNEAMRLHVRRDHTVCANGVPTGGGRTVNTVRPSNQPKTRSSIYLQTSLLTKVARRLAPKHTYNPRHHARHPCEPISSAAIAQHCQSRPWKEIQNMMKVICRSSRNDARAAGAVATPGPSGGGGGGSGGTHSKRRKRYLNSPGEVHPKRVRKSEVAVSDYGSWKAASDGCMFVTKALKQLRQKLTSGQVHRLARNPFKESKALLSVVGAADSGGAEKATA